MKNSAQEISELGNRLKSNWKQIQNFGRALDSIENWGECAELQSFLLRLSVDPTGLRRNPEYLTFQLSVDELDILRNMLLIKLQTLESNDASLRAALRQAIGS